MLETVTTSKQLMSELSKSERLQANRDGEDDAATRTGEGATGGPTDAPSIHVPQSAFAGATPIHATKCPDERVISSSSGDPLSLPAFLPTNFNPHISTV